MPKIKGPGYFKSSNTEDGNTASKVSLPVEQPKPYIFNLCASNRRSETVLITIDRNPSTVFKPPFGTNVDEHHSRLGEHTQYLWKCKQITDLTVKLQEVQYPCHKTVLSCYSQYFKALLLAEKKAVNDIHLRLPGITNRAFEVLLSYMYTSNLDLTCQNIDEVYTASRHLGVDGALILCRNILTGKSKHKVHSVYVYVTCKKQQLHESAAKALKMMTRRFEQIVGTPEFLDLDFSQVKEYLSQDVLATRSEVIVYLAALKWLSVKFLEREQYAVDVISCVRFQMMTLNEILACFSPPMLPGILELKEIRDKLLTATCYVVAVTVNEEKRFERYACRPGPRRYFLKREPIILWDTSIYDPDRHAMYAEAMAATTIQAAFRGYKARKSIEVDKAVGILSSRKSNLVGLDEFDIPGEEDDLSSDSGSKLSIFGRLRKSIVSFTTSSEDNEKDTSIYDPDRHEMYDEEMAATTIQAAFRGYRARKSIEADKAVGILSSRKSNLVGLDEFDIPGEEDDINSDSGSKLSIFGRPRKSNVSFMTNSEDNEKSEEKKLSKRLDEEGPAIEFTNSPSIPSRSRSNDTLVGHVNNVAENTEIRKYTSDTAIDTSSEAFQKTFARPKHETVHKVHSGPSSGTDGIKETPLSQVWRSDDDENQSLDEKVNGYILATGGLRLDGANDDSEGKAMYLYNSSTNEWKKLGNMKKARHHHRIVRINKEIYFIGGCNPRNSHESGELIPDKSCFKFDLKTNEWYKISKMRHSRFYHGVTELDGKIYVVGGKDDTRKLLDSVEVYTPESNTWQDIESLKVPTMGAAVCAHEGKLWVVGGMTELEEGKLLLLGNVQCYDPVEKRWRNSHLGQLPFPKAFSTIVSFENEIYMIGGISNPIESREEEFASVPDVMLYDHREKRWFSATHLPYPRHMVEAMAIGTNLYVLGGFTSFPSNDDDELIIYDKQTRAWRSGARFPDPLRGFAAICT